MKFLGDFFCGHQLSRYGVFEHGLGFSEIRHIEISKIYLQLPELEEYLKSTHFTDGHLDQLAKHFYDIGILEKADLNSKAPLKHILIAKKLLDLLDKTSNTITFERMGLKEKVEKELQD